MSVCCATPPCRRVPHLGLVKASAYIRCLMLNASQLSAATAPPSPLLIIAGAGTGKTNTLAHRVAHLIKEGADPGRILLLTFTRRAAEIMVRRASSTLPRIPWA